MDDPIWWDERLFIHTPDTSSKSICHTNPKSSLKHESSQYHKTLAGQTSCSDSPSSNS